MTEHSSQKPKGLVGVMGAIWEGFVNTDASTIKSMQKK